MKRRAIGIGALALSLARAPAGHAGFGRGKTDENLLFCARCLGRFRGDQRRGLPLSRRLRGVTTTQHDLQRVDAVLPRPRVYERQRAKR